MKKKMYRAKYKMKKVFNPSEVHIVDKENAKISKISKKKKSDK